MDLGTVLNTYSVSAQNINIIIWALVLFLFVLFSVIGAAYFLMFNVKVVVYEKVGLKGQRSRVYSARKIHKDNVAQLKIFGSKETLKWPNSKYVTNNRGIRFKTLLTFFNIGASVNDWKPIEPELKGELGSLKVSDSEVTLWAAVKSREKIEKYKEQGFWSKYGAIIGIGLVAMLLVLTIIFSLKTVGEVTTEVSNTQKEISGTAERIAKSLERINTQKLSSSNALENTEIPEKPIGG